MDAKTAVKSYLSSVSLAAANANASPERAAKALKIAPPAGLDPTVVNQDIEGWAETIAKNDRVATVRSSPPLQTYISQVPLGADVSSDDYPALIRVAETTTARKKLFSPDWLMTPSNEELRPQLKDFFSMGLAEAPGQPTNQDLFQSFFRGFAKHFGSEMLGLTPGGEMETFLRQTGFVDGNIAIDAATRQTAAFLDSMIRVFSGVTGGIGEFVGEAVTDVTGSKESGRKAAADIKTLLDITAIIMGTRPSYGPRPPVVERVTSEEFINRADRYAPRSEPVRPWHVGDRIALERPGVAAMRSIARTAGFDAVERALRATKTRERSPASAEAFARQQVGEETIGVPPEAVRKLYEKEEKVPAPGDGVLGFDAQIAEKLERAERTGADVELDAAKYLARVEEDIHNALLQDLRVGVEGETVNEVREIAKAQESIDTSASDKSIQLFRGDISEIKEFDATKSKEGGLWLTPSKRTAGQYGSFISTFKARFKNPIEIDWSKESRPVLHEIIAEAKRQGHDALILKNYKDNGKVEDQIVVFDQATLERVEKPISVSKPFRVQRRGDIEQEASEAKSELFLNPLFESGKAAGMTEPQLAAYSRRLEAHVEAINQAKHAQAEQIAKRQVSQEWKETLAEEKSKAAEEFDARPDVVAEQTLRSSGVKIRTTANIPRGLADDKGVLPDEIADLLGYSTGEALIRDLAGLEKDRAKQSPAQYRANMIKQAAELATEARLSAPEAAIEQKVLELVTDEPLTRLLHDEVRVMRMQNEGEDSPALSYEELRDWGYRAFGLETVKQGKNLKKYLSAVQRRGREAEIHAVRGDIKKAFRAKNQQLLSTLIANQAVKFRNDLGKAQRLIDRYAKHETVASRPQEFVDQIQRLLMQLGVPVKRNPAELAASLKGVSLKEFVERKMIQDGYDLNVATWLFDSPKKLDDMTVAEWYQAMDSIKSLDHVGQLERQVMRGTEKEDFETAKKEMVDKLKQMPRREYRSFAISEKIRKGVYGFDALLVRLENIFMEIDEWDPQGPWNTFIERPLQAGKVKEDDLFVEAGKKLRKLPRISDAKALLETPFIDMYGNPWVVKKADVVMWALHQGSRRNRELLARTLMPPEEGMVSDNLASIEERVRGYIDSVLTEKDWKFVQGMWDFFSELKPQIDDLYRRSSGVAPDTVEAEPVRTRHGEFSGGYAPIIHDSMVADTQVKIERSTWEQDYHRATTPNSYTMPRTEQYNAMMVTGYYDILPLRIREMLHDLAFREPIQQVRKFIYDPQVRQAFTDHYGPEYAKQLDPWLKDIANRFNVEDRAFSWLAGFFRGARQNIVIYTLGLNLKTILTPQLGPLIADLGIHPLDTVRIIKDLPSHWNFVMERSGELRHRINNYDRNVREALQDQLGTMNKRDKIREASARFGMYPAVMIDTTLAMITWLGEYRKAMEAGAFEDNAIYAADQAVRRYFGSQGKPDIPAIMRLGEISNWLTMFYGYMNSAYNGTRDAVQLTRHGVRIVRKKGDWAGGKRDFARAWGQTVRWFLVPAIFGLVYNPDIVSDVTDSGRDDAGDWINAIFKVAVSQLAGSIPLGREVAALMIQGYPTRSGPGVSILQNVAQNTVRLVEGITDDDPNDKWIKQAASIPGYVLGLPLGQAATSTQFLWNMGHNLDHARSFQDWATGIIYGETRNKRRQR